MNIGLITSDGRMAPCFPGTELWILNDHEDIGEHRVVSTIGWKSLAWGSQLMRRNVTVLLCSGVDRFLCGALQGYGIRVVPNAKGSPVEVIMQWRNGGKVRGRHCRGLRKRKGRRL
jgi:hypothetical protein